MTYEVIDGARLASPARTQDAERAPLRIGVVQADWEPDARRQRDKLADGVRLAAAHGAQLVCTQELTLSPYFAASPEHARQAARYRERIPDGPTTDFAATLARETGTHVHASLYEAAEDGGLGYNTAVCVRARRLVYPTAIGSEPNLAGFDTQPLWEQMITGNGLANATFMVAVNRVGSEAGTTFYGSSFVSDPYGRVLVRAPRDRPAVLVAELDLDQRRDWLAFGLLSTRRPEVYAPLTTGGAPR